jgi:hypothetical protein
MQGRHHLQPAQLRRMSHHQLYWQKISSLILLTVRQVSRRRPCLRLQRRRGQQEDQRGHRRQAQTRLRLHQRGFIPRDLLQGHLVPGRQDRLPPADQAQP